MQPEKMLAFILISFGAYFVAMTESAAALSPNRLEA
jgi:hypothetical protein